MADPNSVLDCPRRRTEAEILSAARWPFLIHPAFWDSPLRLTFGLRWWTLRRATGR